MRIIDANLNRLKEGIRVVEDIFRYQKNDKKIASRLKELRHLAIVDDYLELLKYRDIINDPLKNTTKSEKIRENLETIIIANLKRAQESSRVLEEIYKLKSIEISERFKFIRYQLYDIEKEIFCPK